ncbi:zinc finger protein 513 isoform X3 [Mugil cephalus]|uniref:zinc finger protein 513 isoform X3 n=1 Tax=Mugil cephalus TaxID=48193 RepID=UPI001FB57A01|nr:zinc finger protein 513 isoform X3 [Mugil cephalus]
MPRRKQSNPQPVKLGSEDGAAVVSDPGCLVLESDFLLSGELEFGDSEIMGLDRESGMTVFSLSVEDDPSAPNVSTFPAFLSCKGCGQLLGDTPLGAGLDLVLPFVPGVGLDLGAELYCLTCEEGLQHAASFDSSASPQVEGSNLSDRSISGGSDKKRRSAGKAAGGADTPPKLYSCSLCTFTSRYSNHLKRHMRTHDGQKPYRCPVCPYASAQLVNLQRHARTHTGEKPYPCHQCSYACSSLGNLRRHQRMHAQEKPQRREKEKRRGRRKKSKGAESEEGLPPLLVRPPVQRRLRRPLQPGGVPRIAARPAQHQALPLPSLPLPVQLPQPPGAPRPHPLRGEAPPLPALPLHLLAPRQPQTPPARAHGGEALPVPVVQLRLREPRQPAPPRAHPLGRQAVPLRRLRLLLQPEHEPEEAHAQAHGGEAVRLRRVQLHHGPLGQLQAPPEETRTQHGQLGQTRPRPRPRLGQRHSGGSRRDPRERSSLNSQTVVGAPLIYRDFISNSDQTMSWSTWCV